MTSIPLQLNAHNSDAFMKKQKIFCQFFSCFESDKFSKKDDAHSLCISEITDHERRP